MSYVYLIVNIERTTKRLFIFILFIKPFCSKAATTHGQINESVARYKQILRNMVQLATIVDIDRLTQTGAQSTNTNN